MTAQGKSTAAALATRIAAGEPVRILAGVTEDGRVFPAAKVTGNFVTTVTAVRVEHTTGHGFRGRAVRHYVFTTPYGEFALVASTTLTLAPETPAGVKRAHVEALAEDETRYYATLVEEAHTAALAEDAQRDELKATADQQPVTVNPLCARVDKHDRHDVYVRGLDGAWSYRGTCEGRRIVDDRIILTRVSPDEYRHEATGVRVFRSGPGAVWYVQAPGDGPLTGGNPDRFIDNVMPYAHTVIRHAQRQQAAALNPQPEQQHAATDRPERPHRSSYAALVTALRDEFDATALESISIQMREHLNNVSSIGVLARAVYNAYDVTSGTGEMTHPDVRAFLDGRGAR